MNLTSLRGVGTKCPRTLPAHSAAPSHTRALCSLCPATRDLYCFWSCRARCLGPPHAPVITPSPPSLGFVVLRGPCLKQVVVVASPARAPLVPVLSGRGVPGRESSQDGVGRAGAEEGSWVLSVDCGPVSFLAVRLHDSISEEGFHYLVFDL